MHKRARTHTQAHRQRGGRHSDVVFARFVQFGDELYNFPTSSKATTSSKTATTTSTTTATTTSATTTSTTSTATTSTAATTQQTSTGQPRMLFEVCSVLE